VNPGEVHDARGEDLTGKLDGGREVSHVVYETECEDDEASGCYPQRFGGVGEDLTKVLKWKHRRHEPGPHHPQQDCGTAQGRRGLGVDLAVRGLNDEARAQGGPSHQRCGEERDRQGANADQQVSAHTTTTGWPTRRRPDRGENGL
jgi:hypothetical protein